MSSYLKFKVIKIIDEYSIVINGGLEHDVSLDDDIEIFVIGEEIIDPFNENKSLGTLDFIKARLKVTEIYPSFSVCENIIETKTYEPSAMERAFSGGSFKGKTITTISRDKMLINEDQATGRMKPEDKIISIGDNARIALVN